MKTVNGSGIRHGLWFCFCTFLFGVIFLLFFPLIIGFVYGDKVVASTLNLSVSSDIVDLDISPLGVTGSFAKSDNINIAASTTNATGYTLGISASSSDNYDRLINSSSTSCDNAGTNTISTTGTKSTNCLTSINEATTEEAFGAFNGSNYNGLWGYLPSKYNSASNASFLPAPRASGDILDKTDSANVTANTYTIAIGARVDSTVKMDSYSNTYNVLLVSNAIPYTITYNDGVVSNMPVDVNSTSETTSVSISNLVPVREGHTFLGWCTVAPTTVNNIDTCVNGTVYNAGDTWIISDTNVGNNNLILNAMWRKTGGGGGDYAEVTVNFNGVNNVTFVDPNRTGTTISANTSGTVVDLKLGVSYNVTVSLIDGYAFDGWSTTANGTLSSTSSSSAIYSIAGTATLSYAAHAAASMQSFTKANCQSLASSGDYAVSDNRDGEEYTVRYINGNCWMTQNLRFQGTSINSSNTNINTSKSLTWYDLSTGSSSSGACYGKTPSSGDTSYTGSGWVNLCKHDSGNKTYGVWYNFAGASAGTVATRSPYKSQSTYSICPAGWRLPTASENSSVVSYKTEFNPVGGYAYYNGYENYGSELGKWWSSTYNSAGSGSAQRYLHLGNDDALHNSYSAHRFQGIYIRCIRAS